MLEIFVELSSNLFITYMLRRYMKLFFDMKAVPKWKELAAYLLFCAGTSIVYFVFHTAVLTAAANIVTIWLVASVYQGEWKKKAFVTFLVYFIMIFSGMAAANLVLLIRRDAMGYITAVYVMDLLIAICEYIARKFMVKNKSRSAPVAQWDLLLAIPLISILLILLMENSGIDSLAVKAAVYTGLLAISITVFHIYDRFVELYVQQAEINLLEKELEGYANQLDIMICSEDKVRQLRHDLKHHFNQIMLLAQKCGSKELTEYVQSCHKSLQNPQEYVNSGNVGFDSLINLMLDRAKRELKKVDYHIQIPRGLEINPFDLNIIIGNLMENAISASAQSEEQMLEMLISFDRGVLCIDIRNSFSGPLIKKDGRYVSTKAKGDTHGIGLENVKRVARKYSGELKIEDRDRIFHVTAILYVPDQGPQ